MRARARQWITYLQTPVDAASLGVFRIVFGGLVAWDAYRYLAEGWVKEYFVAPAIHFPFFSFVQPWPGNGMYVHFWVMIGAAIFVATGLLYRPAIAVLFGTYTYFFLLEKSVYMNHYYLIDVLAFLLLWMPADRAFALGPRRAAPACVPRWCILILRFQLFVMYFYGAVAKLNPDWLRGEPMYSALLHGHPDVPPIASHLPPALLAYAIAYGGIVCDFAIPILLSCRRTVCVGFALAVLFHTLNHMFLHIGIFSFLAVGAITIFFSPDWPRRLFGRTSPAAAGVAGSTRTRRPLLLVLHFYALLQILIPLRHFLYPGYVSWTEEGHRFAWHMKLRFKRSELLLTVRDPANGRTWHIDPAQDLRPRQLRKLHTFPDILLNYVHHHRDALRAQGIPNPVITADWRCSLNGRPYQRLVDPNLNLAEIESSWRPASWILPLHAGTQPTAPPH